jgi:hypothetical protein
MEGVRKGENQEDIERGEKHTAPKRKLGEE